MLQPGEVLLVFVYEAASDLLFSCSTGPFKSQYVSYEGMYNKARACVTFE